MCRSPLPTGASTEYTIAGDLDAFVLKLARDDRGVEWLTQIGGSHWDAAMDVAVDRVGAVYVVGTTYSPNLPTTRSALADSYGGGEGDAFVARLSPAGTMLWLTYLGGSGLDDGRRIAVDAAGNAYIAGRTASRDFPVHGERLSDVAGTNHRGRRRLSLLAAVARFSEAP